MSRLLKLPYWSCEIFLLFLFYIGHFGVVGGWAYDSLPSDQEVKSDELDVWECKWYRFIGLDVVYINHMFLFYIGHFGVVGGWAYDTFLFWKHLECDLYIQQPLRNGRYRIKTKKDLTTPVWQHQQSGQRTTTVMIPFFFGNTWNVIYIYNI
jgi:hypothetical protein